MCVNLFVNAIAFRPKSCKPYRNENTGYATHNKSYEIAFVIYIFEKRSKKKRENEKDMNIKILTKISIYLINFYQ